MFKSMLVKRQAKVAVEKKKKREVMKFTRSPLHRENCFFIVFGENIIALYSIDGLTRLHDLGTIIGT